MFIVTPRLLLSGQPRASFNTFGGNFEWPSESVFEWSAPGIVWSLPWGNRKSPGSSARQLTVIAHIVLAKMVDLDPEQSCMVEMYYEKSLTDEQWDLLYDATGDVEDVHSHPLPEFCVHVAFSRRGLADYCQSLRLRRGCEGSHDL